MSRDIRIFVCAQPLRNPEPQWPLVGYINSTPRRNTQTGLWVDPDVRFNAESYQRLPKELIVLIQQSPVEFIVKRQGTRTMKHV